MNLRSAIENLEIAAAFQVVEMFCTKPDNGGPKISVRLWDALRLIGNDNADKFCDDFNKSIAEVTKKWADKYYSQGMDFLKSTESPSGLPSEY